MDTVAKRGFACRFKRRKARHAGRLLPYEFLRYNSSLPKRALVTLHKEISVTDLVYVVLTVLFFGVAILYLRACERLK